MLAFKNALLHVWSTFFCVVSEIRFSLNPSLPQFPLITKPPMHTTPDPPNLIVIHTPTGTAHFDPAPTKPITYSRIAVHKIADFIPLNKSHRIATINHVWRESAWRSSERHIPTEIRFPFGSRLISLAWAETAAITTESEATSWALNHHPQSGCRSNRRYMHPVCEQSEMTRSTEGFTCN